ncbi:MAG: hypothetical protein JWN50_497 [Parcubacteria group bacterium]|nr:hypothetical protein [Parcubacteria group bacterium]
MSREVDRKSEEIMKLLEKAPIFSRFGFVHIRPALEGERVITKLANGAEETENIAQKNEWVVRNPSGEEWIIDTDTFRFYEPTEVPEKFISKGFCRAVKNPFGEPIEIMASWGSRQIGDENCMIVDACNEDASWTHGEPKIIDGDAFQATFTPLTTNK